MKKEQINQTSDRMSRECLCLQAAGLNDMKPESYEINTLSFLLEDGRLSSADGAEFVRLQEKLHS